MPYIGNTVQDFNVTNAMIVDGTIQDADIAATAAIDAAKLSFTQDGTGAVARTVDSKLVDVVNVADFGAIGNGTNNDTTAIQAAIDSLGNNGGVIEFNVGTFLINATLNLTKKIHLVGKGGYFLNQFVDNQFTVGGTTIKLADGSNTDMLKIQLDNASIGADYRSHCSIRNIHFFGNRSNAQNPTNTTSELNSSGNGIVISGVRYVTLENVIVTKCADDGLKLQSHTYSSSPISTNNIDIRACAFHSNGQNGATLAGGDSIMDSCTVGYNANNGITTTGFGVISNSLFWDNFDNGIFVAGSLENPTIVGNKIYDNDHVGIYLDDAADAATSNKTATAIITGNKIIRNGGNSSSTGNQSSGIFINTVAINELVINGNEIGNTDDLWDTSKSYTTGNRVINAGRLYIATASISSGGSAPTHTSGTTNNWEEKATVQDYGIYFNKTETIIRGFSGNEITRNFINNIFIQTNTNPIILEPPGGELYVTSGNSGDCVLILEADEDNNNEHDNPYIEFRQDGGIAMSAVGMNPYESANDNNALFLSNSVSGGAIIFKTGTTNGHVNATEKMRILADGGLCFNGDNTQANALDDYEEGTFTPLLQGSSSHPTSVTYTVQSGHYTKIGNLVHIQASLSVSAYSGGGGEFQLGGLPFTALAAAPTATVNYNQNNKINWGSGVLDLSFYIAPNSAQVRGRKFSKLVNSPLNLVAFATDGFSFGITGTYIVT